MKNILKDYRSLIINMIVNQIAITIFGFVLAMACVKNDTLLALSSVLSILFYLFLLYFAMYERGQKDGIRIAAGRLENNPLRGMMISLCANAVNIVLGILAVIGKLCITNLAFFSPISGEFAATPEWAANLFGVTSTIAECIQCMYQGVAKVFFSGNVLNLLLRPIPAILVCTLAYPLGVKYSKGFLGKKKKDAVDRYR